MADAFSSIKGLLESGKYADLTIRCSGEIFKVHCAIVCPRSPFLSKAVDGQFMEAALRDIDLSADELPIVRAMIQYLYTDDYYDGEAQKSNKLARVRSVASSPTQSDDGIPTEDAIPAEKDKTFPLMFNVKMYIIGDKYDIPGLRALATKKYQSCVGETWNSPVFSVSAQYLWENTMETDRRLRDIVVEAAYLHLDELFDRGEFVEFMNSHGDFAFEVLKLMRQSSIVVPSEVPGPEPEVPDPGPEGDFVWDRPATKTQKKGRKL